jgi:hypothetical protein
MFGLLPWLAQPNFWSLTASKSFVWISAKDSQPSQFFGHTAQFSRPRVGQMLVAKSFANILACQFWQGSLGGGSKQPLSDMACVYSQQLAMLLNLLLHCFPDPEGLPPPSSA